MDTSNQILKKYWGHDSFRFPQREIIESVLSGKDTLALLPTGGGKSVCFQVPTLLMDGLCLVITPLIALMQDQVRQLKSRGIQGAAVHSGMSLREIDTLLDNCIYGNMKFLYLSPERLQTELFQERVKKMKVCLVAVDEAHCISQWGYDFRPPYLQIAALRELLPDTPFIALTASATREVKADIILRLELKSPAVFQKSFARDNLSFVSRKTEAKEKQLLEILRKVQGSAIVYVRSRKATQDLAQWLTRQKIPATFYHAGLDHEKRSARQNEWQHDHARVIVATNAFGMGIDKSNVRLVIHMDLPENPEAYYQEAGRAGRDGNRSYAVLIFHPADVATLRNKVALAYPGQDLLKQVYQAIANFYQLAVGSGQFESFDFDLDAFCKRFGFKSSVVFPAIKKLQEEGLIELSDSFYRPSTLHMAVDNKKLYEFQVSNALYDPFLKSLLRLYGGELFSNFLPISENQIAHACQWKVKEVRDALTRLSNLRLVDYVPASESPRLTLLVSRQDAQRLPIDIRKLDARRKLGLDKMEAMINYAEQDHRCRMQWIQEYFDEITDVACGLCDVCLERKKKENMEALKDFESQVLYLLGQKSMSVEDVEKAVDPDDHELFLEVIREMVDRRLIEYDDVWLLKLVRASQD